METHGIYARPISAYSALCSLSSVRIMLSHFSVSFAMSLSKLAGSSTTRCRQGPAICLHLGIVKGGIGLLIEPHPNDLGGHVLGQ